MTMKFRRLLALSLAALFLLTACKDDSDVSSSAASSSSQGTEESAGVAVRVQTIASSDISNENRVSGKVTAENQTAVMVGTQATVTKVFVEAGDYIHTGDPICTLDLASTLDSYNAAVISRDSAKQSYDDQAAVFDAQLAQYDNQVGLLEQQRDNYNSQIELLQKQTEMTQKQMESVQGQIDSIQGQIDMIDQQLEVLNTQKEMAEKNVSDTEALLNIGAASQAELDQAKLNLDQANLGITQAESNREQLEVSLDQAKMSIDQYQLSIDQNQLNIDQAMMGLSQNQSDMDNIDLGRLSTQAQKNSTLAQLEAGVQSYQSNVDQLATALKNVDGNGNVVSPGNGTILQLNAVENGMVAPTQAVAVIDGIEQLKIIVPVSEATIPKVSRGDTVDVELTAAGISYEGMIREISSSADVQTSLYNVTVSVPDGNTDILSGMFADVTFRTDTSYNTIVVPSESILTSDGEQYVFVVENDTAVRVPVTTGLNGNGVTEILTGLQTGQVLVTVGQAYLSDGDPVRIISEAS